MDTNFKYLLENRISQSVNKIKDIEGQILNRIKITDFDEIKREKIGSYFVFSHPIYSKVQYNILLNLKLKLISNLKKKFLKRK